MAGHPTGTIAHVPAPAPTRTLQLVPASTRTRRNHGVFSIGGQLACIYSSRRSTACYGVSFELGAGTLTLAGAMTPAQARTLARALTAAAAAAELAQGGAA